MRMITSPDILRKDTVHTLGQINAMIQDLEDRAERIGSAPHRMRDSTGSLELSPLLLAKVIAISTLVDLNSNKSATSRRA